MKKLDIWEKCVLNDCVIVPVKVYAKYNEEGNVSDCDYIGIKYVVMPFEDEAVGPEYYCMLDEMIAGNENYYNTPEDALNSFINKKN